MSDFIDLCLISFLNLVERGRWRLRGKIVNTFLSSVSERKTQRAETKYDIRGYQVDQHLIFLDRYNKLIETRDMQYILHIHLLCG